MAKVKLPRKRKKLYKKHHGNIGYMAAVMVNEMCINGELNGCNPIINHHKFTKELETIGHHIKRVISYY